MIQVISLYESTHDLLPNEDIKMRYNVNTMHPIDIPDKQKSDIDELKETISTLTHDVKSLTSLTTKRPRLDDPNRSTINRQILKARRHYDKQRLPQSQTPSSQQQQQQQQQGQTQSQPRTQTQQRPDGSQQRQLNQYTPRNNTRPQYGSNTQPQRYSQNYRGNNNQSRGGYRTNQRGGYNTGYRGTYNRGNRGSYRGTQRNYKP